MTRHSPAAIEAARRVNELRAWTARNKELNDLRELEQHGLRGGNAQAGCRCAECNRRRAANTERKRASKARKDKG